MRDIAIVFELFSYENLGDILHLVFSLVVVQYLFLPVV